MTWLADHLFACSLDEECEDYALGRGALPKSIVEMGLTTWEPLSEPSPDAKFGELYGKYGEKIEGALICPLTNPRGDLLGFEARSILGKRISQFKVFPKAAWNPVWIGCRRAMARIYGGGDIWVVEGQFDLYPLEWVIPETDVVLASLRAQLTRAQVEFLRRVSGFGGTVHMVYDRDETGKKGVHGWVDDQGKRHWGALEQLRYVGVPCDDVPYRGGEDLGEVWDSGGVEAMRRAFPTLM